MKKKKELIIKLDNRLLYTIIALGILLVVAVGVYAATYTASGAGHPYTEISTCSANQILKMNSDGTVWTCATITETDPDVASWAKPSTASPPVVSTGLYGTCQSRGSTCYAGSKEPEYCNGNVCACRAGYTQVMTAIAGSDTNTHNIFACYKN